MKVPTASPAIIVTSVVATAIGKKAKITERDGLSHYPSGMKAGIAPSGYRKSHPFKHCTAPIEEWIADRIPEYEREQKRVAAKNAVIDSVIKALRRQAEKQGADTDSIIEEIAKQELKRLPPVAHPRMFTTDATEEMVFRSGV